MRIDDRLGILSDEVLPGFEEALDWIAAQGLRWVEVRTVDGTNVAYLPDAEVERVAAAVRRRGLRVSAVASPLFKCALDPARPVATGDTFGAAEEDVATHLGRLPRTLAIARALGTRQVRVFSFWREREPARHVGEVVELLRRAADVAAGAGMVLLLENEPSCNGGFAAEAAEIVRRVDRPALRLLWDPGNEAHAGRTPFPGAYREVRPLLAHVHLKDVAPGPDGSPRFVPLGAGRAEIAAQIAALEADGYGGLYVIETHYVPEGGTRLAGSAATLDGLRTILAGLPPRAAA